VANADLMMRPQDQIAFLRAAAVFRCAMLVRKTNPESLRWIGVSGVIRKPIDCRAKTADKDVVIEGRLRQTAGLVVEYRLGLGPYKSPTKAQDGRQKFETEVLGTDRA
jgi:hypothetical protein